MSDIKNYLDKIENIKKEEDIINHANSAQDLKDNPFEKWDKKYYIWIKAFNEKRKAQL